MIALCGVDPKKAIKSLAPALIKALKDRNPVVRYWAVHASAQAAGNVPTAERELVKMLDDEDAAVKVVAAYALSRHAHDSKALKAAERICDAYVMNGNGIDQPTIVHENKIHKFTVLIGDVNRGVEARLYAMFSLWKLGKWSSDKVTKEMVGFLDDTHSAYQEKVIEMLAEIEPSPALVKDKLSGLVESLNPKTRSLVAKMLSVQQRTRNVSVNRGNYRVCCPGPDCGPSCCRVNAVRISLGRWPISELSRVLEKREESLAQTSAAPCES